MKNEEQPPAVDADQPGSPHRPSGVRTGLILLGLAAVAFAVILGARVKGAVGQREVVAQRQAATVESARVGATKPPSVAVARGEPRAWEPQISFEGSLVAMQEAELGFKAAGRIAAIAVKVGDKVRRGQVLARLASDEAAAQLAAAEAQLAAADAQAQLAVDAEKRTSLVVETGAQSEAAGVQARQQRRLAEAQRGAAEAQVQLARTALANHTLTAPFAGTVTRAPNAPGAVIGPGVPLFHLADLSTLKLTGAIGAGDAPLVQVGAAVEILGADGKPAGSGKVTAVVPALDQMTKRIPVEAAVSNAEGAARLLAGAVVRARVRGGAPVPVFAFPHTSLRPGSQNELLVVTGDRIQVRKVEHVVASDGALLVRAGVEAQDEVILRAWPEAENGQAVAVERRPTAAREEGR